MCVSFDTLRIVMLCYCFPERRGRGMDQLKKALGQLTPHTVRIAASL